MKINNFVMILTTKGRYAVTAALYIAKNGSDQAINLSEISHMQNISLSYLEQIFCKLKNAGDSLGDKRTWRWI
jgi:Rrf2 family iron-sulfur cluster assembly transcriptional regulator